MDKQKLHGFFNLKIVRDGVVIDDSGWIPNLICTAGLAQIALLAGDASAVPFTYLAVGTSNTAVSGAHTGLQAEITDSGLQRASATVSRTTTTSTNDTLQLYKEFSVTGSKTVEECGVFNASSGVTMLARALTTSKSLVNGDILQITYKVSFADDGV